jgi:AraC-like DNA-binding protein
MPRILPAGEHNGTVHRSWLSGGLFVCRIGYDAQTVYDEHGNARASLIIVERGHCSKRLGRETLDLKRGSLLFIPPRCMQVDSFPVATRFLAAELSSSMMERLREVDAAIVDRIGFAERDAHGFGGRLLGELMAPDAVSEIVFEGILLNMVAYVRRKREDRHRQPPSWLARAKELLHDRAFEALKLQEVAGMVGVAPSQLSREFERFFKVTPGEYLRQLRIERATRQLEETGMALADIATACGFADQAHFSRAFRQRMRCAPGQYRRLTKSRVRTEAPSTRPAAGPTDS